MPKSKSVVFLILKTKDIADSSNTIKTLKRAL